MSYLKVPNYLTSNKDVYLRESTDCLNCGMSFETNETHVRKNPDTGQLYINCPYCGREAYVDLLPW